MAILVPIFFVYLHKLKRYYDEQNLWIIILFKKE